MVFLFDSIVSPEYALGPDGRYETSFAGITGCKVQRFGGDKGAGLDPFAIFPSKRVAANFLASVAKVENDQDLLADLYLTAEKARQRERAHRDGDGRPEEAPAGEPASLSVPLRGRDGDLSADGLRPLRPPARGAEGRSGLSGALRHLEEDSGHRHDPDLEEEGDSGRRGMVARRDQPEDGQALFPAGGRVRARDCEDREALQRRLRRRDPARLRPHGEGRRTTVREG